MAPANAVLIGWRLPGADNPSLTINPGDHDVTRSTVKFPARSVVLHPGPHSAVSATWRSPEDGPVRISARVTDADPHCGDGIEWAICQSGRTVASGVLEKGKSAEFAYEKAVLAKGELLALVVRPRANYSCDSTRVEWSIRSQDGRVWDLQEALLKDGGKNLDARGRSARVRGPRFADSASELRRSSPNANRSSKGSSPLPNATVFAREAFPRLLRGISRRAHSRPRPL
jgi:hypothetical protein